MTQTTTPPRDPLAGDPAEAAIRSMVETIVREARPHPLAVILFGARARRPSPHQRRRFSHRPTRPGVTERDTRGKVRASLGSK